MLTAKQSRFVQEYALDFNATEAAKRAGYSKKTAYSIGHENLRKPEIVSALAAYEKTVADELLLSQQWVIDGLMVLAQEAKSDAAKVRAFELLGKHQGMFTDRLEITQVPDQSLVAEWITALEADVQSNG